MWLSGRRAPWGFPSKVVNNEDYLNMFGTNVAHDRDIRFEAALFPAPACRALGDTGCAVGKEVSLDKKKPL